MATITFRKVNYHAWANNTFLQCYGYTIVKLTEYKNGRIDCKTQDGVMRHCQGSYTSEYNGWSYTLKKLLSKPLKIKT